MNRDAKSMGRERSWIALLCAALGMACALTGSALAQAPEDPTKTVTMLASHAPGGGYDAYARLYARHVGRFLP